MKNGVKLSKSIKGKNRTNEVQGKEYFLSFSQGHSKNMASMVRATFKRWMDQKLSVVSVSILYISLCPGEKLKIKNGENYLGRVRP